MRRGFGGWTPRADRVSGPIVRILPFCPYCGVRYDEVKAGRSVHDMARHPSVPMSPLRFAQFDTRIAIDSATPRALRSKHAT